MPVTVSLSRKLYDVLSEDVVNELVEWFNLVDATYRGDLRELNEVNFARFDAKQEQRLAQFEAKMDQRFAQFDVKLEQRFAQYDVKIEQRFTQQDLRIELLRAEMNSKFDRLEDRITAEFAKQRAELLKWMFLFWATTALGVIGLFKF